MNKKITPKMVVLGSALAIAGLSYPLLNAEVVDVNTGFVAGVDYVIATSNGLDGKALTVTNAAGMVKAGTIAAEELTDAEKWTVSVNGEGNNGSFILSKDGYHLNVTTTGCSMTGAGTGLKLAESGKIQSADGLSDLVTNGTEFKLGTADGTWANLYGYTENSNKTATELALGATAAIAKAVALADVAADDMAVSFFKYKPMKSVLVSGASPVSIATDFAGTTSGSDVTLVKTDEGLAVKYIAGKGLQLVAVAKAEAAPVAVDAQNGNLVYFPGENDVRYYLKVTETGFGITTDPALAKVKAFVSTTLNSVATGIVSGSTYYLVAGDDATVNSTKCVALDAVATATVLHKITESELTTVNEAFKFTGASNDQIKINSKVLGTEQAAAEGVEVTAGGTNALAVTVKDGALVSKDLKYYVVADGTGKLVLTENPKDGYEYLVVAEISSAAITPAVLFTKGIENTVDYVLVRREVRSFSLTGTTNMVYAPSEDKVPSVASYGEFKAAKKWNVELVGEKDSVRLKTEEGYLQYKVNEAGEVSMSVAKQPTSKFFLGGETITSKHGDTQYTLKLNDGVSLVKGTEAADAKVNVYADLTPNTDASGTNYDENGNVIGAPANNAVLYFKIGEKYLTIEGNDVVLVDEVAAGEEQNASWIFEQPEDLSGSNKGYYKSLAKDKYLFVPESAMEPTVATTSSKAGTPTVFSLLTHAATVINIAADNSVTVSTSTSSASAVLGFAQGELTTSKLAGGVQMITPVTATLQRSNEIVVPDVDELIGDYVNGANYVAGNYYVLSIGGDMAVRYDAGNNKCILTDRPDNASVYDLWKMVEAKNGDKYTYSFVSKADEDVLFTVGGENTFIGGVKSYKEAGAIQLRAENGNYVSVSGSGELELAATTDKAIVLCKAGEQTFYGHWMNERLGNGFEISITDQAKKKYTGDELKNNPFKGVLKAVNVTSGMYLDEDNNTISANQNTFFLRNAEGDYLALNMNAVYGDDNESMNGANSNQRGYKFTAISADEYNYLYKKSDDKNKPENYKFEFCAVYSSASAALSYDLPFMLEVKTGRNTWVKLYVTRFENEYVLTSSLFLATEKEEWPLIKFDVTGLVKKNTWLGQAVNIEYAHTGKHAEASGVHAGLGVSTANRRVDATWNPVDTVYCQLDKPEGQWIVTESGADGYFCLVNRESGKHIDLNGVYHTANDNNVFAVVTVSENHGSFTTKHNAWNSMNDTLKITVAPSYNKFTGYANFDAKALETQAFNLSVVSELSGKVYTTEPDGGHKVGLSKDVEDAAEWRLVKFETGVVKGKEYNQDNTDSIISTIKWNDKDGKAHTDFLVAFVYAIRNDRTGEYLKYDADKQAYVVDEKSKAYTAKDYDKVEKFILKEKRNGAYNIIPANPGDKFITDFSTPGEGNYSREKLYGAFSETKLNQQNNIYKLTDNDLFKLDEIGAPVYVGAEKLNFNDTIKIVKNDNERFVMYEQGHFLGMQHVADVEKMAPAMFVDTAFVRGATYKPQYMLVVEPDLVWHKADCGIDGHPAIAPTMVDSVKGRFLINMVDSAVAYGLNKHDNPYIWENNSSYKLSFLNGYHTGDNLYLNVKDANGKDKVAKIAMGNNENRIGKYAFRYVDREAGSFTIETSYDGTDKVGYIKYLNGVLSVVADPTQAEVFNLSKTSETPTNTDDVQLGEVSVIASEGAVIINGAAGKTVLITNVLGQTVANTVLSSDNATISASAGVVVVAVEGEAAVKAIVK